MAIARELGVSPATVCRDITALLRQHERCPECGQLLPLGVGGIDPDLADEILAECQAEAGEGTWQWAGRGPMPRPRNENGP